MDRKNAIEWIEQIKHRIGGGDEDFDRQRKEALDMAIVDMKICDANNAGWISVKDRLPEKQTPVLVYVPPYSDEDEEYIGHVTMSYYTHSALGGYWAGTDGNVYGAIGIIHEPTHWMPLPEMPKEEQDADRE